MSLITPRRVGSLIANFARPGYIERIRSSDAYAVLVDRATGARSETPVTPTFAATDRVVNDGPNPNAGITNQITIEDVSGNARITIGFTEDGSITAAEREALDSSVQHMTETPEGRSLLAEAPIQARNQNGETVNDQNYRDARPAQQEALRIAEQEPGPLFHGPQVNNELRRFRNSDGARTSLEYHEWRFNMIATGKNWFLLTQVPNNKGLTYTGTDAISPNGAPPYYRWVQIEDLRKLINLVKRFRRLRSGCGGKALWQEQGFATKEDAIEDDIENSAEAQSLIAAIIAFGPSVWAAN